MTALPLPQVHGPRGRISAPRTARPSPPETDPHATPYPRGPAPVTTRRHHPGPALPQRHRLAGAAGRHARRRDRAAIGRDRPVQRQRLRRLERGQGLEGGRGRRVHRQGGPHDEERLRRLPVAPRVRLAEARQGQWPRARQQRRRPDGRALRDPSSRQLQQQDVSRGGGRLRLQPAPAYGQRLAQAGRVADV